MADIDVVKKSSNVWVWVIVALAIIVLLFMLFGRGGGTTTGPSGRLDGPADAPRVAAVATTVPELSRHI
jgi:hypothetical protein